MTIFNRCTICDYTEDHGSMLLNKPPKRSNTVHYRKKLKEYLCHECYIAILRNYYDDDEDFHPNQHPFAMPIASL